MEILIKSLFGYIIVASELLILQVIVLKFLSVAIEFAKYLEVTFKKDRKVGF